MYFRMGSTDRVFREALQASSVRSARAANSANAPRQWIYIHEDQLTCEIGPLARERDPSATGVILVEHHWKAALRPYHRHRLALIWANQRHFALELARRGIHVEYILGARRLCDELQSVAKRLGLATITMMEAAERETRHDLSNMTGPKGLLRVVPHEGWLTTRDQFHAAHAGLKGHPRWKMDSFYRFVRKACRVLVEADGSYVGGKVSFDTENRESWSGRIGEPPAAVMPTFQPDAVTNEVIEMVESDFARHPGAIDPLALPATQDDAHALWAWAKRSCLRHFGPYEDAMSVHSRTIFHTRISSLVNIHRLLPRTLVADAERLDIPLQSKEGFIRQILGWREFVKHVHDETDGFRSAHPALPAPGDGGFAAWAGHAWQLPAEADADSFGGAAPEPIGGSISVPRAYWQIGTSPTHHHASGMACLDHVARGVWTDAWSHHITRLMVLSNVATLLDISPRDLTDWFWIAFSDAWDWVVEPNVLAMGTYSVGELMTTKPYVSGSAYIDKMSDYCASCSLDPAKTCPITRLYWAFLARHEPRLKGNARMMMPMRSLAKRAPSLKEGDARVFVAVRDVLVRGERVTASLVQRAAEGAAAASPATPARRKQAGGTTDA